MKILLVEDSEDQRYATAELLKLAGYQVFEAGNGGRALWLAKYHDGDIVLALVDLSLPDMTGWELIARLRAYSKAPCCLVTGDVRALRAPKTPGVEVILKPVDGDVLKAIAARHVRAERRRGPRPHPGPERRRKAAR